ncbi:GNAT family N-acetyltransferase [Streptomyces sp. NPDC059456]|uniref:GNAT family N-acetyltransferase n=1 Tax=Streptomyces sp. NPDC059456 TaxID=3346838 RepID=UPI00369DE775
MSDFLETDRLVLRAFTEADTGHLFALDNDPEVMRFINGGRPTSHQTIETVTMPRLLHDYACWGTRGYWAAREKSTGTFLGWFEFRPLEEHSPAVVELGYRLRRAAWGRGYATEGSRALIRKGFTDLDVERVTANTMAVNAASRGVMEKSGLSFVRHFTGDWPEAIEGSEHGEVEYEVTRARWERASQRFAGGGPATGPARRASSPTRS